MVRFSNPLQPISLREDYFIANVGEGFPVEQTIDAIPNQSVTFEYSIELKLGDVLTGYTFPSDTDILIPGTLWNGAINNFNISDTVSIDLPEEVLSGIEQFFVSWKLFIADGELADTVINDMPESVQIARLTLTSGDDMMADNNHGTILPGSTSSISSSLDATTIGPSGLQLAIQVSVDSTDSDVVVIEAGMDPKLTISISFRINSFEKVEGVTKRVKFYPAIEPYSLDTSQVQIVSGEYATGVSGDTNSINMTFTNGFPMDVLVRFDLLNFFKNSNQDTLSITDTLPAEGSINNTVDLGGWTFRHYQNVGSIVDYIVYSTYVETLPSDSDLTVNDTVISIYFDEPIGSFTGDIQLGTMKFDKLSAYFNEEINSPPQNIEKVPTGMSGIGIGEVILTLTMYNQIKAPINLYLNIVGKNNDGDSLVLSVFSPINIPESSADTATTAIQLNSRGETVWWGNDTVYVDTTQSTSIVDLINFAPSEFKLRGIAKINGLVEVSPGDSLWGKYEIQAPFIIIPDTMIFIPQNVEKNEVDTMDTTTREKVMSSTVSGKLFARVVNKFPLDGFLTILWSDSNIFPLNRDDTSLVRFGIDSISGDTIFFANNRTSYIDTLIYIGLPKPVKFGSASGNVKYVLSPGDSSYISYIDSTKISRIVEPKKHFIIPRIQLNGTTDKVWIRASDYVRIQAYLGFTLTSESLLGKSE
jgi:hypothetical protein